MTKKSKLPNGLKIITTTNKNVETIVVAVGVKVGARYEAKHEEGLSHALEHMLFKGTEKRSGEELNETVDFVGAQTNAFTSEEHTVYYIKGLKAHLEMAMDILSDQVLNSNFPAAEMEKEMSVIEQEIKRSADDSDDMMFHGFNEVAFKGSPLEHPILGTAEQVLAYKPSDMFAYYTKHYQPKNMVLSVAGNVKHKDVVELAQKYFVAKGDTFKKTRIKKAKWNPGQKVVHVDSENQVQVCIGWELPGRDNSTQLERNTARLVHTILSSGMSSKLFREIREKRGLVYSVGSHVQFYDDLGCLYIMGGTDHNKVEEFMQATALVLKNFNADLTDRDLQKAKNDIKATMCMQVENTSSVAMGQVDSMLSYGKPYNLKEQLENTDALTLDDIKAFMTKTLQGKPVLSVYGFVPQAETGEISVEKFEQLLK